MASSQRIWCLAKDKWIDSKVLCNYLQIVQSCVTMYRREMSLHQQPNINHQTRTNTVNRCVKINKNCQLSTEAEQVQYPTKKFIQIQLDLTNKLQNL